MAIEPAPAGFAPHAFGTVKLFTRQISRVSVEDQLRLNENQPRHKASWESPALQGQIKEARGLFTPPLVQPTGEKLGDGREIFEVIDGHRRVTALRAILADIQRQRAAGTLSLEAYEELRDLYSTITVECTHRRLDQEELVKVWILIHRERKEWSLQEREETANKLIELVGSDAAAKFMGVTVPMLVKLSEIYKLAARIKLPDDALQDTGKDARITWAREIRNLREEIRNDDEVVESLIARINSGMIRNSKDIRVLRDLLEEHPDKRSEVLDPRKDLWRDIAMPLGIEDPVRATRKRGAEDLDTTLSAMASAIRNVKVDQVMSIRGSKDKRVAARKSIEAMMEKLKEFDELFQ